VPRPACLVEFAYLRAAAIVAVIVIHTVAPPITGGSAGPLLWPYVAIDVAAHVAVPLFVFVSGAVLMHAHPPPVGPYPFIARRLTRLLPPYIAVSAVYLLVRALEEGPLTAAEIVLRLFTGTAWFHLWFVVLVVELTLIYPVLAPWVRFARPRTIGRLAVPLALLASAYFLLKVLLYLGQPGWVLSAVLLQGLAPAGYLLFFVAGMAVTAHPAQVERLMAWLTPARAAPAVLVALLLGAARFAAWLEPSPVRTVLAGLSFLAEPFAYLLGFGLALAAARDFRLQSRARLRRALVALGGASYGIYLVQGGVIDLVTGALARPGLYPASAAYLPATVLATLALSWGVIALATGAVRSLLRR
jgi:probable poly-beta-1,6-N-acetyl-D-glucosamine export protein